MKSAIAVILGALMTTSLCHSLEATVLETNATPSIANIEQTHRFPQTKISFCDALSGGLRFGRSDLQYTNGDLTISGVDDSKRAYTAVKGTSITGCEIWSADLDGNGTPDLEVLTKGSDSSDGYDSELSVILFDSGGQPMPWQAVGYFTSDVNGVKQIVRGGSANNANVIVSTEEGLTGPNANVAFELYTFAPSAVRKTTGNAFGLSWPLFQNPTPALIKHQASASLSFDLGTVRRSARLAGSNTPHIKATSILSLDNGQQVEPPAVIVEVTEDGSRNIIFDPMPSDITKLVNQHSDIETMGRSCEEEECRPFILISKP